MADPKTPGRFESDRTLFLLEEEGVFVLGDDGTEALIPYEDLEAFLQELLERLPFASKSPDDGGG